MPRGDKSKYTNKQERKADHIAEGYEKRGLGKDEAKRLPLYRSDFDRFRHDVHSNGHR